MRKSSTISWASSVAGQQCDMKVLLIKPSFCTQKLQHTAGSQSWISQPFKALRSTHHLIIWAATLQLWISLCHLCVPLKNTVQSSSHLTIHRCLKHAKTKLIWWFFCNDLQPSLLSSYLELNASDAAKNQWKIAAHHSPCCYMWVVNFDLKKHPSTTPKGGLFGGPPIHTVRANQPWGEIEEWQFSPWHSSLTPVL